MATHDITIDDGSPLITYTGDWSDSSNDDIVDQYWLSTYHSTSEVGASASFKFTGTAVYLYGSKRPSHGTFDVDIDGTSLGQLTGKSTTIKNMELLASATGLEWGEHTITITNSDPLGNFLDIDQIKWTTGRAGLASITNTTQVDDADASGVVSYSPSGSWTDTDATLDEGSYHENTVHATSTLGSSVAVRFAGNAVYVFGSTDTSSGKFDVQIDNKAATPFVGATSTFRQPALLYYTDGLGSDEHTLTLTNQEEGTMLRFDYLVASKWADGTSSSNSASASGTAAAISSSGTGSASNNTAIIGGVVGGVVGLAVLVLFAMCCIRLKRAASMDDTRSDLRMVPDDGSGQQRPRPLSHFSWNRPTGQGRPVSTVSGISGVSGPGMAGVGAHRVTGAVTGAVTGWAYKRRSAQQADMAEKAYSSNMLQVPSR